MVIQNPTDWTGQGTQWGDFGGGFGAMPAQSQYTAMMRQGIPGYQMPGYAATAQRGFAPAWGTYMLGTPTDARLTAGSAYGLQTPATGGIAPSSFGDWYASRNPMGGPTSAPTYSTNLGVGPQGVGGSGTAPLPGWNVAQGLSGQIYGSEGPGGWNELATGNLALSEAMQEDDAVRAMAMAQ